MGVTLDGVPAGIELSESDLMPDLARRKSGGFGTTPRIEADLPQIVSGVWNGHTTGAPLTILFSNTNTRSGDYSKLRNHPRPSHADLTGAQKFDGWNDPRGGGHFSGRLTLGIVAAGVVAKKILKTAEFQTQIVELGGVTNPAEFDGVVADAVAAGDSVGGVIECRVEGIPAGLGEPFWDSVESVVAHALFAVPAVKGVEFGDGFAVAEHRGSEMNDDMLVRDGKVVTETNHAGGIYGGITNGAPILFRLALKPTPSIFKEQSTVSLDRGENARLSLQGRHDPCIVHRAAPVVDAVTALTLADMLATRYGTDYLMPNN